MSLSVALRTALSGLTATQTALQVTSDNITNANTPGHTRKTVEVESRRILSQGAGVETGTISREVDEFVLGQIRDQLSTVGDLTVRERFLRQIQNVFGSPEDNRTISSSLTELKNAFEALSLTPEFDANSSEVVNVARQLVQLFNELADTTQQLRLEADNEIERLVGIVDRKLVDIAELNVQVARAVALNQSTAALEDERDRALNEVAEHMDIRVFENSNGTINVFSNGGRLLVNGGTPLDIAHTSASQVGATASYLDPSDPNYPGAITGIFVGGSTAAADDITDEFTSGSIKALIDMRDSVLPNLQNEIDQLAQTLTTEINKVHNQGTAFPPPSTLTGSHSFVSGDVFSATGSVRVAVIDQTTGDVVTTSDIALGGLTTIGDVVTAIDGVANLSASLNAQGKLVITADNAGQGIAINELTSAVTTIGSETRGLSHFFGANDLFQANVDGSAYNDFTSAQVSSSTSALGLAGTLTFGASGVSTAVAYTSGQSLETIATNINANGTLSTAGITASVIDDGAGRKLVLTDTGGDNFRVTDSGSLLSSIGMSHDARETSTTVAVRSDIIANPSLVAKAQLSSAGGLAAGDDGVTAGDATIATALAGVFDSDLGFDATGGLSSTTTTLSRYASSILAVQTTLAADSANQLDFNQSFLGTLEFRNASISGVNIDEELANLVVLEQAFNASSRVITVVSELFDELLNSVR